MRNIYVCKVPQSPLITILIAKYYKKYDYESQSFISCKPQNSVVKMSHLYYNLKQKRPDKPKA